MVQDDDQPCLASYSYHTRRLSHGNWIWTYFVLMVVLEAVNVLRSLDALYPISLYSTLLTLADHLLPPLLLPLVHAHGDS